MSAAASPPAEAPPTPPGPPGVRPLTSYRPFWARRFGPAPFLPTTRAEMDALGWDSCDIVIVTGDAYVDHPSFGMAVVGRVLEAQGFRVGIVAQPDWDGPEPFRALGRPNLFFGVAAGNMDSMINHYTADRKIRSEDAYTPGGERGRRPDRAVLVYTQRCREAYKDVPVVIGGIEASLRRIAHYDYWQDKVRRSVLADSKADLLVYGNAERALVEIAHRLARRESVQAMTDIRGTAFVVRRGSAPQGFVEIDSTEVDRPGPADAFVSPYEEPSAAAAARGQRCERNGSAAVADGAVAGPAEAVVALPLSRRGAGASSSMPRPPRDRSVIRLPSYEQVRADPVLYAHASRVMHLETNPGNARALVQRHGERDVWVNPPPVPLTTPEMDHVFGLPYARSPHPRYADDRGRHDGPTKIPAWEMIRFSVNIMRGCFGGCSFCSITEHEGRIIQSRSEASVLREIEDMRDKVQGFTGVVSDLGGPTANMYRLGCRSREIEAACRKPSCVWPGICANLRTDHAPLVQLYRHARALPGVRKVLIASGLRYDLAVQSPEYVRELVEHHVGGYLKIAPEHTEPGPLARMMKPGIGSYDRFKAMFEAASAAAGKQQYLIPYFIAAHPGTTDEDMLQLALWLKRNGFKADQVQAFYPTPLSSATAMYHTGIDTLHGVHRDARGRHVDVARGERRRRLHKAFLRWHDADNWPLLREALHAMGRDDLIGSGRDQLVPRHQPAGWASGCKTRGGAAGAERPGPRDGRRAGAGDAAPGSVSPGKRPGAAPRRGTLLTQHTGLPPRAGGGRGRR
ncbi:MAG: YgiQ family radical SAM protein [Burkholderiaceae bacterium]|nr:YgiQ family radical SAM protein [Burkholderiaceae bacterium]